MSLENKVSLGFLVVGFLGAIPLAFLQERIPENLLAGGALLYFGSFIATLSVFQVISGKTGYRGGGNRIVTRSACPVVFWGCLSVQVVAAFLLILWGAVNLAG